MLAPHTEPTAATVFAPRTKIEPDGTVEGYASLFGEIDQARDKVMRGAFADSLRTRGINRIPILFQRDPAEPVGVWLDLHEDARGLYARAAHSRSRARPRAALFAARRRNRRLVDRLPHRARPHRSQDRGCSLMAVDLWAISIVTFPLLTSARVHAVKQASSPPQASPQRTRAERAWARAAGNARRHID